MRTREGLTAKDDNRGSVTFAKKEGVAGISSISGDYSNES